MVFYMGEICMGVFCLFWELICLNFVCDEVWSAIFYYMFGKGLIFFDVFMI